MVLEIGALVRCSLHLIERRYCKYGSVGSRLELQRKTHAFRVLVYLFLDLKYIKIDYGCDELTYFVGIACKDALEIVAVLDFKPRGKDRSYECRNTILQLEDLYRMPQCP